MAEVEKDYGILEDGQFWTFDDAGELKTDDMEKEEE